MGILGSFRYCCDENIVLGASSHLGGLWQCLGELSSELLLSQFYRCSSGIPELADIKNLLYVVSGEITSPPPSTGKEFGSIATSHISDAFQRSRYSIFGVFHGYVLTDGYSWSLGLVSCVIYIVPPCIPNTRLHNQKVSGVNRWELK